jgi:hypothetical protein
MRILVFFAESFAPLAAIHGRQLDALLLYWVAPPHAHLVPQRPRASHALQGQATVSIVFTNLFWSREFSSCCYVVERSKLYINII